MTTIKTVTIETASGSVEVPLKLPQSYALRRDLRAALAPDAGISHSRVLAAALGVCWAHSMRLAVPIERYEFSIAKYGGHVLDELVAKGWDPDSVLDAGLAAWQFLYDSITKAEGTEATTIEQEAEKLAGFTPREPGVGTHSVT